MNDPREPRIRTLAVVSGGLRQPSSTRLLADRVTEAAVRELTARGVEVSVEVVELREHANDLTSMLLTGFGSRSLTEAIATVTAADGVIAVTPIFSGSYSGLFKNFFDVLQDGSLAGVPVLLGATAGTARHSLAIEHALRPLFSYLRAVTVPTGVFAATEDLGQSSGSTTQDGTPLAVRVERGAAELAALIASAPRRARTAANDRFGLTVDFGDLLAGS